MRDFKFKTKPYDHQLKAWEDSWSADYYALFMEMGTGKSKVAIDTIGALYKAKRVSAALILAPKGVYDNWVKGEIPTHLPDDIEHLTEVLTELPQHYRQLDIVFLDATEEVLLQRFSSTRRKHPLTDNNISLAEAIDRETELLGPVANMADLTLDTTSMSVHDLRGLIKMRVAGKSTPDMAVLFQSFGFKQGIPLDADFVFDVRCLPNPYWQPELRPFTGQDEQIRTFLSGKDEVNEMFTDIESYLLRWLPRFEQNNRSYLTVAIGCTGGQHRSVYLSERLTEAFRERFSNVQVRHRELNRLGHS